MAVMSDEAVQPYQRITRSVRSQIRSGRLKPGDKLPSTRALAAQYGVAHGTVQRALAELRTAGLIYSHQGLGVFVADRSDGPKEPSADLAIQLADLAREIADLTERVAKIEHHTSPPE